MKNKLPTGISVLIALVLVASGLLYGTWSGYSRERAEVTALLTSENGLMDVLDYRAADGFNLCVVARRHLDTANESLAALEKAARTLCDNTDLAVRREADRALGVSASEVSAQLTDSPSFQQDVRDQNYLAMLLSDLNSLSSSAAVTAYNQAAQAFNQQLNAIPFGILAQMMGVDACLLYE